MATTQDRLNELQSDVEQNQSNVEDIEVAQAALEEDQETVKAEIARLKGLVADQSVRLQDLQQSTEDRIGFLEEEIENLKTERQAKRKDTTAKAASRKKR
jgi:uncharacterized small protein (DUF1192 family)